jgi:predicted transcriptional regulator
MPNRCQNIEALVMKLLEFKLFVQAYKNLVTSVQKRRIKFLTEHSFSCREGRESVNIRLRKRERDRIAIVAEILEIARGGVVKTSIMWRAGLSYDMLTGYLGLMTNAKLLDKVALKNKVVFRATDRGMKFLYHCYEIMELLETEDDERRPYRRIQLLPSSIS